MQMKSICTPLRNAKNIDLFIYRFFNYNGLLLLLPNFPAYSEAPMYVRWVVRKHKNASVADMSFHDAYLVESYRDEQGNPRQRTVSYLGNIRQIGDEFPSIERELFLLRAERILSSLPELTGPERDEVLHMLRARVPPLNPNEVEEAFRANVRWYQHWWRSNGRALSREDMLRFFEESESSGTLDNV